MKGFRYYLPGALLVLLGVLILAVPEILVAFVSAALAVTGVGVLLLGHRMRKAEKEWRLWQAEQEPSEPSGLIRPMPVLGQVAGSSLPPGNTFTSEPWHAQQPLTAAALIPC